VRPRYKGPQSDITALESLIVKGVNNIGGKAVKSTVFRFDCSVNGVRVSVDQAVQGIAAFSGLGGAFVRVYMDGNTVSPSLVDSCVNTWSDEEAKLLAELLLNASTEDETGQSERSQTTPGVIFDKEKQALELIGIVPDENDVNPNFAGSQEAEKPSLTSLVIVPQSTDTQETQALEPIGIVADATDVNLHFSSDQEAEKPSLTSQVNVPQSTDTQLAIDRALSRKHPCDRIINQIAKNRARDSVVQQRDIIMDALQSIQNTGSIQEMAFDRASQKLLALASHHVA